MFYMKSNLRFPAAALMLSIILLIPIRSVNAIPAFARKYQISCQVCHSPMARLKPFGEEFAGNGFRMKEFESPRYFIQTGDDKLSLHRELPVAIRLDGFASYNFSNKKSIDFGAPFALKLLSGGELSEKLSYYFYFFMSEAGEIVGVEDAFLMYSDLFGSGINLYIGQFQACDPIYKRELRLTLEDIKILKTSPGNSSVSLQYERGIMFDYQIPGLNTTLIAEVVNGSGIGLPDEGFKFDKDKFKNVLGRISQPLGKNLNIGFFGYAGKELIRDTPGIINSDIRMFGPSLTLDFDEKLKLNLLYVKRTDSNVYLEDLDLLNTNIQTQGGFAEIIYTPKGDLSKWYMAGLLNWVDSDLQELNYKSATFHAGYVLRRNVRLVTELTWLSGEEEYSKFSMGFVSAF